MSPIVLLPFRILNHVLSQRGMVPGLANWRRGHRLTLLG